MHTMFPMIDMRPAALERRTAARAQMERRRRCLILAAVLVAVILAGALGL